jgi:DNA ligase (NAD+)
MSIDNLNEKIAWLNARNAEDEKGHPTVSDKEWDDVYFGLKKIMPKTLDIPANPITSVSPTFNQTAVNELLKIEHNHEMLSLDKTKSMFEVLAFLNNHDYIAMAKMDGLTCSLRYVDGKLVSAETRGNGYIGEDITHNARVINTIPKNIDYEGELVVDGEVISTYANFESFIGLYRNPRNFAAGSIRLLDSRECAKRGLTFIAWDLIKYNEEFTTFMEKLIKLEELGFKVVPWSVDNDLAKVVENIQSEASLRSFPIDGVVFKFNDLAYGDAQGKTTHHFKNAIAYKFYDDLYPAVLRSIEWTMGRTGVLTPVAIFDPIEMDGSIVSRASLHNVSTMEEILGKPFDGEEIQVFKANMIIPQVSSANKEPGDNPKYIKMIEKCPICGEKLEIRVNGDVKELYCANENCAGKLLNQFDHFCG